MNEKQKRNKVKETEWADRKKTGAIKRENKERGGECDIKRKREREKR